MGSIYRLVATVSGISAALCTNCISCRVCYHSSHKLYLAHIKMGSNQATLLVVILSCTLKGAIL